jgi:hypothetical protein
LYAGSVIITSLCGSFYYLRIFSRGLPDSLSSYFEAIGTPLYNLWIEYSEGESEIHYKPRFLLVDAEENNSRMRASVSQLVNFVRDYETEESVDDESPNLVAEASNAGHSLFETVQRSG